MEPPFQHASYYLEYAVREKMWKCDDLLQELDDITLQELESFYPTILSHLHIEGLVHGNLDQDSAVAIFSNIQDILRARPLMPSQFISSRALNLPPGHSYVYQLPVRDPDDVNSAIEYYCQVCEITDIALRARLSLVAQIAQEPCFNQLRTREQLGYLVFSGIRRQVGTLGLRFIIQSERDTIYLENRVEIFLDTLRNIIINMTPSEYQAQVDSLIAEKREKFQNMGQEGAKYWEDIDCGYYEFDDVEKDVKELHTIEKASLLEFFDKYIRPSSPHFRKLSVHMQSQKASVQTSKPKVTIESLHTCLQASMAQRPVSLEQLRKAVSTDINAGLPTETVLQKLLVDELKAKEEDVEKVMTKLTREAGGPFLVVDSIDEAEKLSLSNGHSNGVSNQDGQQHSNGLHSHDGANNHTKLPRNNIVVTDLVTFKNQMTLSPAAIPFFLFSRI